MNWVEYEPFPVVATSSELKNVVIKQEDTTLHIANLRWVVKCVQYQILHHPQEEACRGFALAQIDNGEIVPRSRTVLTEAARSWRRKG